AQAVLHVHRLVPAVGAEQAEQHRQPANPPDLLLDDGAAEDDLSAPELVLGALRLLDAVHVDDDRRLGATGQAHAVTDRHASLRDLYIVGHRSASRTASNGVSPSRGSSLRLRTTPAYGTSAPS